MVAVVKSDGRAFKSMALVVGKNAQKEVVWVDDLDHIELITPVGSFLLRPAEKGFRVDFEPSTLPEAVFPADE